jgi:hypothetical protein
MVKVDGRVTALGKTRQACNGVLAGSALVRANLLDRFGLKTGNVYRPETDKSLNQNF